MTKTHTLTPPRIVRGPQSAVTELLELPSALLEGHFELLAGAHTKHFLAFSRIAAEPGALDAICGWVVPELEPLRLSAIVSPSTAGAGLGYTLAQRLRAPLHLARVDEHGRALDLSQKTSLRAQRVLLVNDVVTTGQGLKRLAEVVQARGGTVVGATWFLTRSRLDVSEILGVPAIPVAEWDLPVTAQAECIACAAGDVAEQSYDLN